MKPPARFLKVISAGGLPAFLPHPCAWCEGGAQTHPQWILQPAFLPLPTPVSSPSSVQAAEPGPWVAVAPRCVRWRGRGGAQRGVPVSALPSSASRLAHGVRDSGRLPWPPPHPSPGRGCDGRGAGPQWVQIRAGPCRFPWAVSAGASPDLTSPHLSEREFNMLPGTRGLR